MASESVNWGYILVGNGRPRLTAQRKLLGAVGVDMSEYGPCWEDILPPRATRPRTALENRGHLIIATKKGDTVHVVNALCLGASGKDALWFVQSLHDKGVSLVIHDGAKVLEPGDELTALGEEVERGLHAYRMRKYRKKGSKE